MEHFGPAAYPRIPESPEDRMRHATAPDRTFAAYLTAQERDQLDARAATAEAERDDALNDRDAYREARDLLRHQLDTIKNRHPGDALADALRNAYTTEHLAGLHERLVEELGDDSPREDPLGRLVDALFAARWQKPAPVLGSPADRAQDQQPEREEVRWAYRWIGRDGQVHDEMDASDNAIETAEQRAHRIAARHLTGTVRGEVIRYRVLTMPAEVVTTYPFEEPA